MFQRTDHSLCVDHVVLIGAYLEAWRDEFSLDLDLMNPAASRGKGNTPCMLNSIMHGYLYNVSLY